MEKQELTYTLPFSGHVIKGYASNEAQLGAQFQIWCKHFGIEDYQSLALLVAGTERAGLYFGSDTIAIERARQVVDKLPPKEVVISVGEIKDWSVPTEENMISVPDELMPLFNSIATQLRFHSISGKSEVLTISHIIQITHEYFVPGVKYIRS